MTAEHWIRTVLTTACGSHGSNLSEAQNAEKHADADNNAHPDCSGGAAIRKAEGASHHREFPSIPEHDNIASNRDCTMSKTWLLPISKEPSLPDLQYLKRRFNSCFLPRRDMSEQVGHLCHWKTYLAPSRIVDVPRLSSLGSYFRPGWLAKPLCSSSTA